MAMQYDVKSAYTASDAAMVTYRARIKGAYVVVSTGGANPIIFYDNASAASGTVLLTLGATVAGAHTVVIPGEGILAENGIFCDTGSAAEVTIFYG
jgi:hypothetical protein